MKLRKIKPSIVANSLALLLVTTSCSSDSPGTDEFSDGIVQPQVSATCDGELYVSGTVSREFSETAWNEEFIAAPAAHVHMSIFTFFSDGPSAVLAQRDVPFVSLPFSFAICANAEEIASLRQDQLAVSIDVFNHAGRDARVGDLLGEYLNSIDGPTNEMQITVTGLEHCDSPNSGGFCTNNRIRNYP